MSVERRIAQLQNDTCTLFWAISNGGLKSSQTSYLLPTNFPTPKLVLYLCQIVGSNIAIDIPAWNPGRDVQIDVIAPRAPRSSDNALNFLLIGNPVYTHSSYSGVYFRYSYSLDAGRWFIASWTMSSATTATGNAAPDGTQYTTDGTYLADAPATVAGWLALHPEWQE